MRAEVSKSEKKKNKQQRNLIQKKNTNWHHGEFYRLLKEEIRPTLHKYFQKKRKEHFEQRQYASIFHKK